MKSRRIKLISFQSISIWILKIIPIYHLKNYFIYYIIPLHNTPNIPNSILFFQFYLDFFFFFTISISLSSSSSLSPSFLKQPTTTTSMVTLHHHHQSPIPTTTTTFHHHHEPDPQHNSKPTPHNQHGNNSSPPPPKKTHHISYKPNHTYTYQTQHHPKKKKKSLATTKTHQPQPQSPPLITQKPPIPKLTRPNHDQNDPQPKPITKIDQQANPTPRIPMPKTHHQT